MRERRNPEKKMKDNDLWRDDISFMAVWGWDLALVYAPFGLLNPASGPALVPIQVPLHTDQALLSLQPFTLCSKQPFCTWSFTPFVARFYFLRDFKVFFAQGHQWSLEYYFNTSCWRMDLYLWMKWDTFRHHFQSMSERRAPRQSSLSTNWSNPLGFVYLNETLRPWGVCWGEVRNAKYRFVFFFIFRFHSGFFLFSPSPSASWSRNPW